MIDGKKHRTGRWDGPARIENRLFIIRYFARVRPCGDSTTRTYISIAMRAYGFQRAYCASPHYKRGSASPQERQLMYVVRENSQSAKSVIFPALAVRALQPVPKLQLSIVDGIVSVTRQYWATADHFAHGFSSGAA